jgi:hypothetical protein
MSETKCREGDGADSPTRASNSKAVAKRSGSPKFLFNDLIINYFL